MKYLINYKDEPSLEHHGIKGQKWGIWNTETALRYSGGKRSNSALKGRSDIDEYGGSSQIKKRVDANKGVHIQAGSQISRMTGHEREINKGAAYYAITKQDADKYKSINLKKQLFAEKTGINVNEWGGKYQSNSKLKEDIWAPSKEEVKKTLGNILSDPDAKKAMMNAMNNQAEGRFHSNSAIKKKVTSMQINKAGKTGVASDKLVERLSNVSGEGRNAQIKAANANEGLKTISIRDDLYKSLSEKGYNAILDYNDMGKVSDAPLIVFNRQNSIYNAAGKDIVKEYRDYKLTRM